MESLSKYFNQSDIDILNNYPNELKEGIYLMEINKRLGFKEEMLIPCILFYIDQKVIQKLSIGEDIKTLMKTKDNILVVENDLKKFVYKYITIIFSKINDFRLVLALFADKVNKITNKKLDERTLIKLSEKIYIPLAHMFGISYYTTQFEDYVIRTKYSKEYNELLRKSKKHLIRDEKEVEEITKILEKNRYYPDEKIYGRVKSPYSVFKKIYIRKTKIEDIYDFVGFRIVTRRVEDCYNWLRYILSIWTADMDRTKDYIKNPKPNGYKSIHLTVNTKDGPVEIQIRTKDMHEFCEYGVAAHWRYKGIENFSVMDKIQKVVKDISKKGSKLTFSKEKVYTFTPKGEIIVLDKGSTALDFAYAIHSEIGSHAVRCMINGKPATLDQEIVDNDVIAIFTDKNRKPSRKWLDFVITKKAIYSIRGELGIKVEDVRTREKVDFELAKKTSIAKCCNPYFFDNVNIYKNNKNKLNIHRLDCQNTKGLEEIKIDNYIRKKLILKTFEIKIDSSKINDVLAQIKKYLEYEDMIVSSYNDLITITIKIKYREVYDKTIKLLENMDGVLEYNLI